MKRSNLAKTRNPILTLAAAADIDKLSPATRAILASLLKDLSRDARGRAEHSWRRHKAPMAAYWKSVAVYARHIAMVLK